MECPNCGSRLSRVRRTKDRTLRYRDGSERTIRQRRRTCSHCGTRYTTTERTQGPGEPPAPGDAE